MNYTEEEMASKWEEFETFLDEIDAKYPEKVKDRKGVRFYVGYGRKAYGDISYVPSEDLDADLEKQIRTKLKEIFP